MFSGSAGWPIPGLDVLCLDLEEPNALFIIVWPWLDFMWRGYSQTVEQEEEDVLSDRLHNSVLRC